MKTSVLLPIALFALAVSCEKPVSEADRNAQIEREVEQRLAAERQAADQEQLEQRQTELEAREKALAAREAATTRKPVAAATPRATARPAERGRDRTSSADGRTTRSYDTFYRKLEPYGAWREAGDYGYVWQPRVAQQSRTWRPYTDGRWAYTDAGWTWVSDEPFGWATYHYGRWTRLRGVGWVWVPGEEWAPAWVSWRTSNDHVGWAPLPPEARFERRTGIKKWADSYYDIGADEYVFIPNEDIGAENIERSVVPVERNVTIVNQTTNVTNITYNNTYIVNEGPNYEELRGRSRRPVERLRLEREYDFDDEQAPRTSVRGDILAIMAPIFSGRATERPRNVGAPIQQATVERNWATSANEPEAQRARAKMKAEATPPPDAPSKTYEKPVVTEPAPTPASEATAAPANTLTPASTTAATAPPASTPAATENPRRGPRATPEPTATPSPVATPAATPKPTATPTPTVTPTPTPDGTPNRAPFPGFTAPPEQDMDEPTSAVKDDDGRDLRQSRGARGDRGRGPDDARTARGREGSSRMAATPTPPTAAEAVESKAVTPAPTAVPVKPAVVAEPEPESEAVKPEGRRQAVPPTPAAEPKEESTPAPTPTPEAKKAAPADEDGAEETPAPTPEGANEP